MTDKPDEPKTDFQLLHAAYVLAQRERDRAQVRVAQLERVLRDHGIPVPD